MTSSPFHRLRPPPQHQTVQPWAVTWKACWLRLVRRQKRDGSFRAGGSTSSAAWWRIGKFPTAVMPRSSRTQRAKAKDLAWWDAAPSASAAWHACLEGCMQPYTDGCTDPYENGAVSQDVTCGGRWVGGTRLTESPTVRSPWVWSSERRSERPRPSVRSRWVAVPSPPLWLCMLQHRVGLSFHCGVRHPVGAHYKPSLT